MSVRTKKHMRLGVYVISIWNGTQLGLIKEYYVHSCPALANATVVAIAATTAVVAKPMQCLTLAYAVYPL